jgi:predicted ArsR family transcriptional regulator
MRHQPEALANQIAKIALLDEPVRRALYLYVSRQPEPVGRDEAADATGTTRENTAFHLDKLVEEGLLEASYRRLGGKTGPGAGRPAKLYQRSRQEVHLTLPARRYDLAAELLAQGLEARPGKNPRAGVASAARKFGAALGAEARSRIRAGAGRAALLRRAIDVLEENGFEPAQERGDVIRLRNCPFDALVREHRELVCGMNLAFMEGVVAGLEAGGIRATMDPQVGLCCVALRPSLP